MHDANTISDSLIWQQSALSSMNGSALACGLPCYDASVGADVPPSVTECIGRMLAFRERS